MILAAMVLISAVGAVLSWAICRTAVIPVLSRFGVLDHPSARSSHDQPVVRGGGIGVVVGWAVSFSLGALVLSLIGEVGDPAVRSVIVACWCLVAVFASIGLADDLNSLPASVRLGLQVIAAAGFAAVVVWATPIGWAGGSAIVLSAVLVVNGVNFMDGLNTLITSWAVLCGTWFAAAAVLHGSLLVGAMAAALAAAALGFLPLNVTPASVFLGDSGSYAVGAGAVALLWAHWAAGGSITVAAAPFVIPIFDVLTTLVRRMFARENIFEAHRSHIYQRLQQTGLTHERAAGAHTLASAVCCAAAVPMMAGTGAAGVGLALTSWGVIACAYAAAPAIAQRRREHAPR